MGTEIPLGKECPWAQTSEYAEVQKAQHDTRFGICETFSHLT